MYEKKPHSKEVNINFRRSHNDSTHSLRSRARTPALLYFKQPVGLFVTIEPMKIVFYKLTPGDVAGHNF